MNADKLVEEIYSIIHILSEQQMGSLSGDTLSRLAIKLASYKASLGEYVEDAKDAALAAEYEYKMVKADAYKKLRDSGVGSTDAKELSILEVRDVIVAMNKAKHQAGLISRLSSDCHDLIESTKGRLITLHTERGESRVE